MNVGMLKRFFLFSTIWKFSTLNMKQLSKAISFCARRRRRAQVAFLFALMTTIGTLSTILFSTLHLVMFVDVLGLSANEIVASQFVFFIWNMANDLLGGVLVHMWQIRFGSKVLFVVILSVAHVVTSSAPFFISSPGFLSTGKLYFISICLVDGFGSVLSIARGSMIEDVSEDESHRLCMQRWDMVFGVIEFLVKVGGFALFDVEDMSKFRIYIAALAFVSVLTTISAGIALESLLPENSRKRKDTPLVHDKCSSEKKVEANENITKNVVSMNRFDRKCVTSLVRTFRFFLQCKEFCGFVGMSVVDEAHRNFNDQFRPIIVDIFIVAGTKQHRAIANTAYVVISDVWRFLMINVADCSTCTKSKIIRISFTLKIIMPLVIFSMAYVIDPMISKGSLDGIHVIISGLMLQLLCELTLASGPGTFFVLFMTNLASPVLDVVQRNAFLVASRRSPDKEDSNNAEIDDDNIPSVLSLMWAFHALIAKPLNSIGPIVGAYYLIDADIDPHEKWNRAFMLLFLIPIFTGMIQICFFEMLYRTDSSSKSRREQQGSGGVDGGEELQEESQAHHRG